MVAKAWEFGACSLLLSYSRWRESPAGGEKGFLENGRYTPRTTLPRGLRARPSSILIVFPPMEPHPQEASLLRDGEDGTQLLTNFAR